MILTRLSLLVLCASCTGVYTVSYGLTRSLTVLYDRLYDYTRTSHPCQFFKSFKNHTRLTRIHSNGPSVSRIRPRFIRLYVRFTRVANRVNRVFCVRRALPKTKKGCEYLLTIMCASTRFPEAIPLRNIKAKTIVNALVKFFTFVGLPKSIQSDQGSNLMSGIFQQVMYELGIKQYKSSAYHPESQGALERFHQTLKNMIRSYCFDTKKDWDEGIHLLLFAVREIVQESLGFSPFELVFGHTVRGPLKLLKEKFLSDDDSSLNLLQYVSDFKTRLSKACEAARSNLKTK